MAKWHYTITSKKRANIVEESNATQKISISGATEIIENREGLFPKYDFDRGKPDPVVNNSLGVVCGLLIGMMGILAFGNDILSIDTGMYQLTSDIIASAGLLITLASFRIPKQLIIKKILIHGRLGNRLIEICYCLTLPMIISFLLYKNHLNGRLANLSSLLCLFIAIKNFHH